MYQIFAAVVGKLHLFDLHPPPLLPTIFYITMLLLVAGMFCIALLC